jgi:hypothetical protein
MFFIILVRMIGGALRGIVGIAKSLTDTAFIKIFTDA